MIVTRCSDPKSWIKIRDYDDFMMLAEGEIVYLLHDPHGYPEVGLFIVREGQLLAHIPYIEDAGQCARFEKIQVRDPLISKETDGEWTLTFFY